MMWRHYATDDSGVGWRCRVPPNATRSASGWVSKTAGERHLNTTLVTHIAQNHLLHGLSPAREVHFAANAMNLGSHRRTPGHVTAGNIGWWRAL